MKRIIWITVCFAFVLTEHLTAQNLYWGTSSHPDPITRHNEAFFDAFLKYATTHSSSHSESGSTESSGPIEKIATQIRGGLCSLKIVSSDINDDEERLCLSISEGGQLEFEYAEKTTEQDTAENNSAVRNGILRIVFNKESIDSSVHEYIFTTKYNYDKKKKQQEITTQIDYKSVMRIQ